MLRITRTLLIAAFMATPVTAGEIYKSVDEQGTPSFSDTQTDGAQKITVDPVNVQPIPTPAITSSATTSAPTATGYQYTKLEITSPANEATLRDQHNISLQIKLEPGLQPGHKIEFLDNGNALQPAGKSTSMQLLNFDRGTHILTARILDNNGTTVKTSKPVTVHIFRTVAPPPPPPPPPTP